MFVYYVVIIYNISMKSNNVYKERTNIYSTNDSAIAFLLALLVPQILIIIVAIICSSVFGIPMASADSNVKTIENTYPFVYSLIAGLIPQISFIGVFFYISERRKVNYQKANQINFKLNPFILLCVIIIGLVAMFGFSPLINMFDKFTTDLGYKSGTSAIDISTFWKFFAAIFYIGLLPAICEELIFRGVITNGLKKYGTWATIIISAVFFALMHQNLQQLIYQLFLGGVMAYIVIKTGSIIYTMILHFFNNFVILLSSYLSGDVENTTDYSKAWNVIYPILLVIVAVSAIVGLLFLIKYLAERKNKIKSCEAKTEQTQTDGADNLKTEKVEIQIIKPEDNGTTEVKEETLQNNQPSEKFYKNIYMIIAFVGGLLFWLFAIISSFVK